MKTFPLHSATTHRLYLHENLYPKPFLSFFFARLVSCSRWSEMTESLRFHIDLAIAAKSPSEFRLLNGNLLRYSHLARDILRTYASDYFCILYFNSVQLRTLLLSEYPRRRTRSTKWLSSIIWVRISLIYRQEK